ncbi:RICIN domain-containing protein, partial [Streptomyces sp. NPDC017890]|uniref:RICIN domain-containing protein n=1 Tax=Streptomyces sp. NPDC017890 TaxID=3365015 RepID=UPI0037B72F5A
ATFLGIALALTLAFVMIWIAYKPQVRTSATEQLEQAGTALAPSPSAGGEKLPSAGESAPLQQPAPQQTSEEPKDDGGGGGGGGGGEKGGGGDGGEKQTEEPAKEPDVVPASRVLLRNTTTEFCAELPGHEKGQIDGPVWQSICDPTDADNQLWNLEVKYPEAGPGGAALFQIRNIKDQLCMDLPGLGANPIRTPVTEFTCDGTQGDNQLWWVDKQESGAYWIRNFASNNACLDVAGSSVRVIDAKMMLYDCANSDDAEWQILPSNQT